MITFTSSRGKSTSTSKCRKTFKRESKRESPQSFFKVSFAIIPYKFITIAKGIAKNLFFKFDGMLA